MKVIVEVSARHVHLTSADVEALFGSGVPLTPERPISQTGQFVANEVVEICGPRGAISDVRVVGPTRKQTQVECSRTDARRLGIEASVCVSGDQSSAAGVTIRGSIGSLDLPHAAIVARRHVHASTEDALAFGLRDGDSVAVQFRGTRAAIFEEVIVRVDPSFVWRLHVDTDEANAVGVETGDEVEVLIRGVEGNVIN